MNAPSPDLASAADLRIAVLRERLKHAPSEMLAAIDAATLDYACAKAVHRTNPHAAGALALAAMSFHKAIDKVIDWLSTDGTGADGPEPVSASQSGRGGDNIKNETGQNADDAQ